MDLNKLNEEERKKLMELLEKAGAFEEGGENVDYSKAGAESIINQEREFGEAPKPNPVTPRVRRILPPEEAVKKMIGTLEAVGRDNYLRGIANPRKNPIEAAIAAEDKWRNKLQEAIKEDRRRKALSKVTMEEWAAMAEYGADKLVDGVKARQYKVERFWKAWAPLLEDHLAKIDALPDKTDADRERRMIENLRGLKKLKGKWRE